MPRHEHRLARRLEKRDVCECGKGEIPGVKVNIGIIGVGHVGGALGRAWAAKGHAIMFGVRDPQNPRAQTLWEQIGSKARLGSVAEAAAFGEVVVLAVPWSGAQEAVRSAGDLGGKILVDVTNPLAPNWSGLSVEPTTSAGEEIARWAEGARVVKAFNSTGSGNMADPGYGAQQASMLFCGDDAEAKYVVAKLGEDLGFDMIDAGPLSNARVLELMALLWVYLAYGRGMGSNIAFKLLRR
jgi:8-hydroxy-5-deazaflavin:NADPH oxidoreductase